MRMSHIARFIGKQEGCGCGFSATVEVIERFKGEIVWKGKVWIFNLYNGPAKECYAWIDADRKELVTALNKPPTTSPELAIRFYVASR